MTIGYVVYGFLLVGYTTVFMTLFLMVMALFNKLRYKYRAYRFDREFLPKISLIVPAHNEAEVIARTIKKFLAIDYPRDKKEMIIVNDDSKDMTAQIVSAYANTIIDSKTKRSVSKKGGYNNIVLVNKRGGGKGKSYVLNEGKRFSSGELLFIIDADIQIDRNAFKKAARHFVDKRVGAVVGYVSVTEKKDALNGFLNFEFSLAQKILRLGFDTIGVHYIIPGGCGIFRKKTLDMLGDYTADTLAEDTDMSWRLITETDQKVHFDPSVYVDADEPSTLRSLWNQRVRWSRGNLEVTIKNLYKVGKRKHGKAATLGYPFWFASIIMPIGFVLSAIGFLMASIFSIPLDALAGLTRIISIAFFFLYALTVLSNRGRYWLQGLISPGIPMMLTLLAILIFPNGMEGAMAFVGYPEYGREVNLGFLSWIFLSLVLTYPMVKLSDIKPKLATIIHLFMFGYWSILIVSGLYAYLKELKGDEKVWVRTVR